MNKIPMSPNLFTALTANPYIDKLYIFGSRATLDDDQFSDIDLTAITNCPAAAENHARKVLDDQFGVCRYIKHRQRQEYWSTYKCYHGFIEQLTQARSADQPAVNMYKELDKQHNDEIVDLFFSGDILSKERTYYEFIREELSNGVLRVWEEYLSVSH